MKVIHCQNIRYKRNKFSRELDRKRCNGVVGFVYSTEDQKFVTKCSSCGCWYILEIKDKKATLTLVDTRDLDFSANLDVTQIGYQTKG